MSGIEEDDLMMAYADPAPVVAEPTSEVAPTPAPAVDTTAPPPDSSVSVTDGVETEKAEKEKVRRTKAYRPVVPVGALFGRLAKRKLDAEAAVAPPENAIEVEVSNARPEGLFVQGPPIGNLSTDKIFEYCAYYSSTPVSALEWVDDTSCVLVYEDAALATIAFNALRKKKPDEGEAPTDFELTPCHPLPMALWPASQRIAATLTSAVASALAPPTRKPASTSAYSPTPTSSEDPTSSTNPAPPPSLKGTISIRRALKSDVKVRNARAQSKYYERHGGPPLSDPSGPKKRRRGDDADEAEEEDGGRWKKRRAGPTAEELDAELERFVSGDTSSPPPATNTTTLSLADRISRSTNEGRRIAPLPGQRRGKREQRGGEREETRRPQANKDALDAELDAFLKEGR